MLTADNEAIHYFPVLMKLKYELRICLWLFLQGCTGQAESFCLIGELGVHQAFR